MTDWLVAAVAATTSITTPSGWTRLAAAAGTPPIALYIVQATVGTTSESFAFTGADGGGVIAEFRGLSITGAADGLVAASGTGTSKTMTGGVPTASGELAICAVALQTTGTGAGLATSAIPSGWNLAGAQPDNSSGDAAIAVFMYWTIGTASAPSAALSWTVTGGTAYSAVISSLK
jgi:hypothetical protein